MFQRVSSSELGALGVSYGATCCVNVLYRFSYEFSAVQSQLRDEMNLELVISEDARH